MRALYDYSGHVRIWLRNDAKWFVDSHGNALAFIDEGSIYNLKGCHVAWWRGDRIRDHHKRGLRYARRSTSRNAKTDLAHRTSSADPANHANASHYRSSPFRVPNKRSMGGSASVS